VSGSGCPGTIVRTVSGAVAHPEGHDVAAVDDLLAEQVAYYRRRASEYDMTAYGDVDAARARITRVVAALRPAGNVLEKSSSGGSATAPSTDWSRSSSIPASWAPGCTSLAGRATSAGTAMTGSSARHAPANRNGRTLGTQPAAPFWRIPEPPHIALDAYWRRVVSRFPPGRNAAESCTPGQ
jgi:hypothetical protein